jgi:hypothetical protein
MKKVLGIILFTVLLCFIIACSPTAETATGIGDIIVEIYNSDEMLIQSKTITYNDGDTLLGLLRANFMVVCMGSDNEPDDTCTDIGPTGTYLLGIDTLMAGNNSFIAFEINGIFASTGIDATPIVDNTVYSFKLTVYEP